MDYTEISVRFVTGKAPPYFIGSQIRGALGYAMKKTVCINPSMECFGCFAAGECLFHRWYEEKEGYHGYRLDFELGRPYYDFRIYLFGETVAQRSVLLASVRAMLSDGELGRERLKARELEIRIDGCDTENEEWRTRPPQRWSPPEHPSPDLRLKLLTPLRIKSNNRFVRQMRHLSLYGLVNSIYQRERMLLGLERRRPPFEMGGEIVDAFGVFQDLTRYSTRQKGALKIGGMSGELTLRGLDPESSRLLHLAELIGAGKQTVFGLGKISIRAPDEKSFRS
jgi:hypothetical protein